MTLLQALILGIIQGITEFLPISSSGHLVLFETWFGLEVVQLRSFDVVLHAGTLVAILIYFRKDIFEIFRQLFHGDFRMTGFLILGTIPAVIAGFTMSDFLDGYFRSVDKVAYAMIGAAVLFIVAEQIGKKYRNGLFKPQINAKSLPGQSGAKRSFLSEQDEKGIKPSYLSVFIIGLFQAIALIPGVSRSGSTISAGLIMGMSRTEAARFSFLLGSIAIFGAAVLTTSDVISEGLYFPGIKIALTGFVSSAIAGYLSVAFLMKFMKKHSLYIFAIYLVLLAVFTFYLRWSDQFIFGSFT